MKMYILVKDDVPLGLAMTAVAHAVAAACLEWAGDAQFEEWRHTSFKKVVCRVNQKEFDRVKEECGEIVVMTESALDGAETAIAFNPRHDEDWPKTARFWRLYK